MHPTKALKAEYLRRQQADEEIGSHLAPWQREVLFSRGRRKSILAGRGSGKSVLAGAALLHAAKRWRNTRSLYLSITKTHAFETAIDGPGCLEELADKTKTRIHIQRHEGRITLLEDGRGGRKTGSTIEVAGMDDWESVRKQRGKPNARAIIDEAGEHRSDLLRYTLKSVLEPRLGDPRYVDFSEMWCMGTPGLICAGTWFTISGNCTMPGWWHSRATARQNPWQDAERYFAEVLKDNQWTPQTPDFRREYLAEWVLDEGVSIMRVPEDIFGDIPPADSNWRRVIGGDYGVSPDPSALVKMRWSPTHSVIVVERVMERHELTTNEMADIYRAWDDPTVQVRVGDTGGGGKVFTHTLAKDHEIAIAPAQKTSKTQQLISMASRVSGGQIKVDPEAEGCEEFVEELRALSWNDQRTDVHPTCSDHRSDACRYALPHCSPAPPGYREPDPEDPEDPDNWDWGDAPRDDLDEITEWIT